MPLTLEYDVDGVAHVTHELVGMGARALAPEPVLAVLADEMEQIEADLFEAEGYGQWPALASSTVAYKAANKLRPEILRATDEMRKSLVEDGLNHIRLIQGSELIFGTSDPKAIFHKLGTRRMPRRDPLHVDQLDTRRFSKAIQAYIVGADRESFRSAGWGIGSFDPFGLAGQS